MKAADIKYALIIGALKTVAFLPLSALYLLSDFFCFICHRVIKYRVKVVRKNLRNSFPEKSEHELRKIEKEFYRHLCDCIVETVKLLHISDKEVNRRIKILGSELIYDTTGRGKPFILFLGHFGNWEWVQAITIMIDEPQIMGALYKPLLNKVMNRVVLRIRSRFRLECIPVKKAYRRLLEFRRKTTSIGVGFIADQRPLGANNVKHWTTFMGQPTAYVIGGETIGDRIGAEYLYAEAEKIKRGHYNINIKKMTLPEDEKGEYPYTRLFFRMLEDSIRRQPAYWLWSHNRWKAKPPVDYSPS